MAVLQVFLTERFYNDDFYGIIGAQNCLAGAVINTRAAERRPYAVVFVI